MTRVGALHASECSLHSLRKKNGGVRGEGRGEKMEGVRASSWCNVLSYSPLGCVSDGAINADAAEFQPLFHGLQDTSVGEEAKCNNCHVCVYLYECALYLCTRKHKVRTNSNSHHTQMTDDECSRNSINAYMQTHTHMIKPTSMHMPHMHTSRHMHTCQHMNTYWHMHTHTTPKFEPRHTHTRTCWTLLLFQCSPSVPSAAP